MAHSHERPHDDNLSSANMLHIAEASLPVYDPIEIALDKLSYFQYGSFSRSQPDMPADARIGSTDIFSVRDRPDLFVRNNEDDEITGSAMLSIDQAMRAARTAGIPIVPFDYFETVSGYTGVVVPRLDGIGLNEALSKPTPELVAEVENIWSAHSKYYATQDAKGEPFSTDISSPSQYMFATMPGETVPHIWMADIGIYTHTKGEPLYQEFYLQELASTAQAILELESGLGEQLPQSRQNLLAALAIAEAGSPYYRGLKRASEYMLAHSVSVDFHDEHELPKQFIY